MGDLVRLKTGTISSIFLTYISTYQDFSLHIVVKLADNHTHEDRFPRRSNEVR